MDNDKKVGTIAIIGATGALGSGLAMRWARAGHDVIIGSRDGGREPGREEARTSSTSRYGIPTRSA